MKVANFHLIKGFSQLTFAEALVNKKTDARGLESWHDSGTGHRVMP